MIVYRKISGVETEVCEISDKGSVYKTAIMGADEIQVSLAIDVILPVQEGDYVKFDGVQYTLNRDAEFTKVFDVQYNYDLIFEHPIYTLLNKLYVHRVSGLSNFTLTGKLIDFVELLVWCINNTTENPLGVDTGWDVGSVVDTEFKNIIFTDLNCREVLNVLANEFNAEYFLNNKQINFVDRIENETGLIFEQGAGKGLYSITQQNVDKEDTVTRIYPRGGNQNVPNEYADYEGYLVLPERYIENFTEHSKVVEKKVTFEDEFPKFIGEVETVSGDDNIILTCPEIDFDIDQVAVGTNARINFLTGDLMGASFEFQWNYALKQITLIRQEDETALPDIDGVKPLFPNSFKKADIGDSFNFTGLFMPVSYVEASQTRLRAKAQSYLDFYSRKRVKFDLVVDYRFMRGKSELRVGDLVTINIPQKNLSKLIRITTLDKNLYTGAISCTVSNYLDEKWEKKIENQISNLSSSINSESSNSIDKLVDILQQYDSRNPSDRNLMSSLRTILEIKNRAISKETNDIASGLIKFLQGIEIGNFTTGALGGGGAFKMINGVSELEVDKLTVRMIATFFELVISKLSHIGGQLILSPARMKCTKVEEDENNYKCYFEPGENNEVNNEFVAGDQARCQIFNGSEAKMYWRLVTSVGDDWINLSKSDCLSGSAIPEVGDDIVQLGHRTNIERQAAQVLSTVGNDAPSYKQYGGINSFSMEGKELTVFSSKGNRIVGHTTFIGNDGSYQDLSDWVDLTDETLSGLDRELSIQLSPDSVTLPALSDGTGTNLTNAQTAVKVFKGGKELFPNLDGSIKDVNLMKNSTRLDQIVVPLEDSDLAIDNNQSIPEWGATDAVYIEASNYKIGGTWANTRFTFALYDGLEGTVPTKDKHFSISFYVWNNNEGESLFVNSNVGNRMTEILPNEKKLVVWNDIVGSDEYNSFQIQVRAVSMYGVVSCTLWRPMIVEGTKVPDVWRINPSEMFLMSTITPTNCSYSVVDNNKIKITSVLNDKDTGSVGIRFNYGGVLAEKQLSWGKAKAGTNGTDGTSGVNSATILLYKRATSTPSLSDISQPFGYRFSTGEIITGSIGAWSRTVPAGTNPLYVISAHVQSVSDTTSVYRTNFSTPTILAQNGTNGVGIVSVIPEYFLHTSGITAPLNLDMGWTSVRPAWEDNKYLWSRFTTTYTNGLMAYTTPVLDLSWNIEIGGVNLVRNGNFMSGLKDWSFGNGTEITTKVTGNALPKGALSGLQVVVGANTGGIWQNFTDAEGGKYQLEFGKQYTLSFLVKWISGNKQFTFGYENLSQVRTLASDWEALQYTFTPQSAANLVFYMPANTTFQITNIQLERGNKRTDFKNGYLEEALKQETEINGGLVLSSIIGTRGASSNIRSYISGLDSNPTAFAAGVENFGEEMETKMVDLRHDGSGHLAGGNIRWNVDGEVDMGAEFASKSISISPAKTLPTLPEIQNKEHYTIADVYASVYRDFYNPADTTDLGLTYEKVFSIENDADITINCLVEYNWDTTINGFGVDGGMWLEKFNNEFNRWDLVKGFTAFGYPDIDPNTQFVHALDGTLAVTRGVYRVRASYIWGWNGYITGAPASAQLQYYFGIDYQLKIKRLVISSGGISFSDSQSDNFFRLSLEDSIPFRYKGTTDIPGVLASGSVASSGGQSNTWGAKVNDSNITPSSGSYTIPHNIGNTKYSVQITPRTASRVGYVATKNTNSVVVVLTNMSGSGVNTDFDYMIVGNN